jgi:hypothetical protein
MVECSACRPVGWPPRVWQLVFLFGGGALGSVGAGHAPVSPCGRAMALYICDSSLGASAYSTEYVKSGWVGMRLEAGGPWVWCAHCTGHQGYAIEPQRVLIVWWVLRLCV